MLNTNDSAADRSGVFQPPEAIDPDMPQEIVVPDPTVEPPVAAEASSESTPAPPDGHHNDVFDLTPGSTIQLGPEGGRYEIVRRLGEGGFAQAFLARRLGAAGFQREVAVKRIRPDRVDAQYKSMFVDEARLTSHLHHPAITEVFDLQELDGVYYLVMEYVPGTSLADLLSLSRRKGKRFTDGFACYLAATLADALHYANTAPGDDGKPLAIVHRDVTPPNIMIEQNGTIKLLDFGVAYSNLQDRTKTEAGLLKGRFSYMSPEQADDRELDGRSDIFSLSILVNEILTGTRIFDGSSEGATLKAILDADPEIIDITVRNVDPSLRPILIKALSRDPSQRQADGAEFAHSLRGYLMKRGIAFGPNDAAGEIQRLVALPDASESKTKTEGSNSTPRRKNPAPSSKLSVESPKGTTVAELPNSSDTSLRSSAGPSETELVRVRDRMRNPQNPKRRLVVPAVIIVSILLLGNLIALAVIHSNGSARRVVESVTTPEQKRAEAEAAAKSIADTTLRAELAPLPAQPTAFTIGTSTEPGSIPSPVLSSPPPPLQNQPARTAEPAGRVHHAPRSSAKKGPAVAAPPIVRHRNLDTSTATTFADAPATSSATTPTLVRGTLIHARLLVPADPNLAGPVTAAVTQDVSNAADVVIPKGSTVICNSGMLGGSRVAIACDGININGTVFPFRGTALGADQRPGLAVGRTGGARATDPARGRTIGTAGRIGQELTGGGIVGELIGGAVGAGEDTARESTAPDAVVLQPAPKGTAFLIFVNSFGGMGP